MGFAANFFNLIQVFFAIVIGLYFWNLLKNQQSSKVVVEKESKKEMAKLKEMRSISLTEPLSEKTRPKSFDEIIGQKEGVKGLKAALCSTNPQHVLIYGPPGIGKTAAARLILEEAKKNEDSPFKEKSKFVEVDATTARFDERGIADPLMGSVHDPIYQGAGHLGVAGIPQPKPGAVTKAHGGILFIDEIGELHPIQMNKLLKVLEDRKVFLDSAYYNSEDPKMPQHIKDIFDNGLPADFRLVGATTRMPQDIPPAIRSRCVEIFFRSLMPDEIEIIATNAMAGIGLSLEDKALEKVKRYATNGRDTVNLIQMAAGIALTEKREEILCGDVEWVVNSGQYSPRSEKKIHQEPQIGVVNGLAVSGPNLGVMLEIEADVHPSSVYPGKLTVTGVIEEEEMGNGNRKMRRKSMAKGSVENVITALRKNFEDIDPSKYDIHVNFPGGTPIDGPSAGVTMATAIYSAIKSIPIDNEIAMTGEVSIRGGVKPIGGVIAKVEAARLSGVKKVLVPAENWQEIFSKDHDIEVIAVNNIHEVFKHALMDEKDSHEVVVSNEVDVLSASS